MERIVTTSGYDTTLATADRRRTGAWYTPPALVEHVVARTIGTVTAGQTIRILDPACGDGRFLRHAAAYVRARGGVPELTGVDIDLAGMRGFVRSSADEPIEAIEADSLRYLWGDRRFDVVIGNPPFLNQLAAATTRIGGSGFGGGTYADAAADFLALSVRLARHDGGRIGLILPVSILTTRDAGPIRRNVGAIASIEWFWWSPEPVFDASVRTCAVGLARSGHPPVVSRTEGIDFQPQPSLPTAAAGSATSNDHWGWLIADSLGLPSIPRLATAGTLAERALVTANFRDQYYGLVGAVSDDIDGPPLITTGLIDVARCHWGNRSTRFAKQQFQSPRVDRAKLAPFMQRWADRCLVPKVLVATQTRVIEAVVDPSGEWLPAVPVVRVVASSQPRLGDVQTDLWAIAAVLTSPVASAVIAAQSVGSGLSATTVRVSQRTLGLLPWPQQDVGAAVAAIRDGDIETCGRLIDAAYGVDDEELFNWWASGVAHQRGGSGS